MSSPGRNRSDAALARLAREKLKPVWFSLDRNWHVRDCFGSPATFGYTDVTRGNDVRDALDFVHGLDLDAAIALEFVETPNGACVHAELQPDRDGAELLLIDASTERDQRQVLQQKSNEVSLLAAELARVNVTLEEKNAETSRLYALQSRFIANMSHEFRTPLSSIVAYTQFLRAGDRRIALSTGLESIDRAAHHLLNLIENLIDQAQFEVGELELRPTASSLSALFDDVRGLFQPIAVAKGLAFQVELRSSGPDTVDIDPTRWQQVLVNLIGNAIKYTERGAVSVAATWAEGAAAITIRDTGVGIASDALESVFEPFHRETSAVVVDGAGLGLSITRNLITLMGGEISVESALGTGTVVTLRLPAPAAAHVAPSAAHGLSATILIVEDDSDVYDILEIYLQDAGYRVVNATDGATALDALARVEPDAVILDLNMPDMSGFTLAGTLRARAYAGPVVMLTASSLGSDRAAAIAAGCDEFLVKPVTPERLTATLAHLLDLAGVAEGSNDDE